MGKVYRFGGFTLDGATRELSRGDERQILPPKMFECLQWLIEHRDRAVGRDELIAAVWGQVDADANVLVQVIARLRRLVDVDGAQSAIRTVPRFGYRWAAATSAGEAPAETPATPQPRAAIRRSPWQLSRWVAPLLLVALVSFDSAPYRQRVPAASAPRVDAVVPLGDTSAEARYQRAWNAFLDGRLDDASAAFHALLADVSAGDAPLMRARVLNGLSNVQYRQGDTAGQRASADEAVALLEGRDAPAELGRALMGRAVALVSENRIEAARRDFQLARVALESGGDRLGMARAELALGVVQKRLGRFGEARAMFSGALASLGALGDPHDELLACTHLVETHLQLLEPGEALALEPRLAVLLATAPPSATRDLAALTRIEALAANGRLAAARGLLARECDDAGCASHPWRLQVAGLRMRLSEGRTGSGADARRELAAALRGPRTAPADATGRDPGRAWLALLRERIASGDAGGAARVLADAQAWADGDVAIETPVYAAVARAESAAARGDANAARGAFQRALSDADANAVPADLLVVAQSYAGWLLAAGEGAEAGIVAGRVAAWARSDYDAALVQLRVQRALGHRAAWQAALLQAQSLAGERRVPVELVPAAEPAVAAR